MYDARNKVNHNVSLGLAMVKMDAIKFNEEVF